MSLDSVLNLAAEGKCLINGVATAELLWTDTPLNFWTGLDYTTGKIVDRRHPLHDETVANRIFALPASRGSYGGALAIYELLQNGCAPAGIVVAEDEETIIAGVIIAHLFLKKSIPVLKINPVRFQSICTQTHAAISGSRLYAQHGVLQRPARDPQPLYHSPGFYDECQKIRSSIANRAACGALDIVARFATVRGVSSLEQVDRARIDACIYTGRAATHIVDSFERHISSFPIKVIATGIPMSRVRWQELGAEERPLRRLDAITADYKRMGATIMPTSKATLPERRHSVYLNSMSGESRPVLPEMIDLCVALVGWAPALPLKTEDDRAARVQVNVLVDPLADEDVDTFYSVLGFAVGYIAGARIPFVDYTRTPDGSAMHKFTAGFVATSSAPLFHFRGATHRWKDYYPRSWMVRGTLPDITSVPDYTLKREGFELAKTMLSTAEDPSVKFVLLGDPNMSVDALRILARHCAGRRKHFQVYFLITTTKEIFHDASWPRYAQTIAHFGASFNHENDKYDLPNIWLQKDAGNIMTNSTRYASFSGLGARRGVHFGTLKQCVDAAVNGRIG
jgi:predicted aconitase/predicted aconitase with swiveling domain